MTDDWSDEETNDPLQPATPCVEPLAAREGAAGELSEQLFDTGGFITAFPRCALLSDRASQIPQRISRKPALTVRALAASLAGPARGVQR